MSAHLLASLLTVTGIKDHETSGPWYAFWSGIGGDIPIIGGVVLLFRKHVCHTKGCLRLGLHPIEGTPYIVCRRHHPEIGGK